MHCHLSAYVVNVQCVHKCDTNRIYTITLYGTFYYT